jgi:mannitol-1-/sugar-/sorbitol-6-phosphatase
MTGPAALRCAALLFDLDGVLVDSTASVERSWRRWAVRHGLDPDALMRVVHGRRAVDTIRAVAPDLDAEAELAGLVEAESEDTADVVALPGAAAFVGALPGDRWAVVTSGSRPVALARFRAAGITPPRVLVTADIVARGKPDPEGYLTAAARLGVPPTACVVVEDAPAGLAAARAGGMRAIALTTTHAAADLAAGLVVPTLAALSVDVAADGAEPLIVSQRLTATPPRINADERE